jgi:hypothetical protein
VAREDADVLETQVEWRVPGRDFGKPFRNRLEPSSAAVAQELESDVQVISA